MITRGDALNKCLDTALGTDDFQESVSNSLRAIALELLYIIENQKAAQNKSKRQSR